LDDDDTEVITSHTEEVMNEDLMDLEAQKAMKESRNDDDETSGELPDLFTAKELNQLVTESSVIKEKNTAIQASLDKVIR
jgi:hypothetical protein